MHHVYSRNAFGSITETFTVTRRGQFVAATTTKKA